MKILLASHNRKKLRELQILLKDINFEVVSPKDIPNIPDVVEDGNTFRENAIKKATACANASSLLTLADDSGLCVDALKGLPSVRSARFAGEDKNDENNCKKLLSLLEGVPHAQRSARFVCVVALAKPGELLDVVEGECKGFISETMRGTKGFGYDPVFIYPEFGKTFAEVSSEMKNGVSHRAQALLKAKSKLRQCMDEVKE